MAGRVPKEKQEKHEVRAHIYLSMAPKLALE